MKIRRTTCVVLLVVGVVAVGALMVVLYFILGRSRGQASDPSYALITAPLNNGIAFLGDPTYVRVSAMLTHRDFGEVRLLVDGTQYVLDAASQPDAPRNKVTCTSDNLRFCGSAALSLLWIPAEAGPHRLSACVLGDEKAAAPWKICTDDLTVVVTDPGAPLASAGTYQPQAGDSIASVAAKLGLPAVLVAAANPGLDAAKALTPDTAVIIPIDPSSVTLPPAPSSSSGPWTVATAGMTTALPIDKSYCYYSLGADYWTRIPAGPATFVYPLGGKLDLTSELSGLAIPAGAGSLAMECWGWSGSSLVPLGSGKTSIEPASSITIHLDGDQFAVDATLGIIPGKFETRGPKFAVPPPSLVTATSNVDVCLKHIPEGLESLFLTLMCKTAAENGDTILVWEWGAPLFPPSTPGVVWLTEIDGYRVYMVPSGSKPKLLATIHSAGQKNLDMPFLKKMIMIGTPCFFVRAYAGDLESANSNLYCLRGIPSGLATVTIDPSVVHFGGQEKHKFNSVFTACKAGLGLITGDPAIGGGEVAVGYDHYWPEDSCVTYIEEYSRAYFGFLLDVVKGPVSSAFLTYRQGGFTSAAGLSCARRLGIITADPSYDLVELLPMYGAPGTAFKVDVTSEVRNWQAGTPNNGFVFVGADESLPPTCGGIGEPGCIGGGTESCWTTYSGQQLVVTYFVP